MTRILVVDDEAHILRVTSMWLRRHDFEVLEAADGAEALALFDDHTVDLIISDMNMPIMSGFDLVKAIRGERGSDVPFLLLTARCDQEKLARELAEFGVRLFPKPFVPSRLVEDVKNMLKPEEAGRKAR